MQQSLPPRDIQANRLRFRDRLQGRVIIVERSIDRANLWRINVRLENPRVAILSICVRG